MPSEKKSRRSKSRNRSTPTPATSTVEKDCSDSDEHLVIDVSMADENQPSTSSVVTRAASSTPKASPEKRAAPSTRKKRRRPRSSSSSSTAEDLEDQTFEETIQRCATKNNLTPECVKKLLKKLVMNEHVLAIVKLKEEEEQKSQTKQQGSTPTKDGTEGDDEDDEPKSLQPKLTRLKAKQLNKQPLPIVPLKTPEPDEEVAALIREELVSDDDDEEYKPTEEEIPSDDDPNTTISDIDSQPRTPATPATPGRIEQDTAQEAHLFSKDGLFKIPRLRYDSHCSQQSEQEQENIARRTRSKLCLQTTAIETIESTFIPPDITTDMYDFDCDMDLVWKEFLNEFTKPLQHHAEDDDDTDPEYVAADKIPIDREELREVKVSKKELNELVSELIEMSGIIDESFLDTSINTFVAPGNDDLQQQKEATDQRSGLNTPVPPEQEQPEQQQNSSSAVSSVDHASFQPNNASTPTAAVQAVSRIPVVSAQAIQFPNSFGVVDNTPVGSAIQPLAVVPPMQQSGYCNRAQSINGQFFVQVSTPDKSSYQPYYVPSAKVPVVPVDETVHVNPNERKYRYLHDLYPVQVTFSEGQTGFTEFQLQILQQQLRMHTQFAAQSFMQCYAHPKFWEMASTFKKMLTDLKDVNPCVKPWNLDLALECCTSWEADLDKPSRQNIKYIQYLIKDSEESEKGNANYQESRKFHPKLMEKIVNCKAFMYPRLLPCTPFRTNPTKKRITDAEERLIAFGLELFFEIRKAETSKHLKHIRQKPPTLRQVCTYISKYLTPSYTEEHIHDFCARRRRFAYLNPIKYYFVHERAPPYRHVLETVDLDNVIPPVSYQKEELPVIWGNYVYSNARLSRLLGYREDSSKPTKKHPPAAAVATTTTTPAQEPNVNITISVILDPQPVTCGDEKDKADDDDLQINQQFLDHSYHPVKAPAQEPSSTLASYVAKFRTDSSQESIVGLDVEEEGNVSGAKTEAGGGSLSSSRRCCCCDCHGSLRSEGSGGSPAVVLKGQKRLTEFFQRTPRKKQEEEEVRGKLKEKVWRVYRRFWEVHGAEIELGSKALLRRVQRHFELIVGFSYFLDELKTMSANHAAKNMGESTMSNGDGRKFLKVDLTEEKDANYAYNFFEKVEETLLAENKHAQYEKFLEILQTFNEKEDRVSDLYHKIESLLIADHPELCDLFLTFLLPGQAAEVGKFFEHFILTNANDFLAKLNVYFAKQPSQIKKIYSCLNDLSNEPQVTMDQIKSRILPLLKGNPFLIEWFIQLFPNEKPPESNLSDYEAISMKKLPLPDYSDPNEIYEDVPFVELSPEQTPSESTVCGTKYIQGRIVYGTLPARLSFLAHDCTVSQSEESPLKGCVHAVRNFDKSKTANSTATEGGTDEKESQIDASNSAEEMKEEQQQQPAPQPRYKLCDDAAFKAHAIRLNPLVHAGKGVNYADVAHLLVPEQDGNGESNNLTDEDKPTSPKKQQQSKSIPKKRINSPVSKKPAAGAGKSSPTAAKKTPSVASVIPADSKVISVSKKLKSMVEAPSTTSSEAGPESSSSSSLPVKRKPSTTPTGPVVPNKKEKSLKKHPSDEQLEEPEQEHAEVGKVQEEQQQQRVVEEPSWTRDEDKVILEEIKNGYSTVEELIERIGAQIKGRNEGQIRSRYEFLMEVLKKFQKTT